MKHIPLFSAVTLLFFNISCLNEVSAKENLRICHELTDNSPYIYQDNLTSFGLLVDIINDASKEIKQPIEIYSNSWYRCQQDVLTGRSHALFAMIATKERQNKFAFPPQEKTDSWYLWLARYKIFTPISSNFNPNTYQPDKGIGAPLGYVVWMDLQQKKWLSPLQYEPSEGFDVLAKNKLDGYVVEMEIGLNLIKKNNLSSKVKMNQYTFLTTKWHLPFNKDFYLKNKPLVHQLWQKIAQYREVNTSN